MVPMWVHLLEVEASHEPYSQAVGNEQNVPKRSWAVSRSERNTELSMNRSADLRSGAIIAMSPNAPGRRPALHHGGPWSQRAVVNRGGCPATRGHGCPLSFGNRRATFPVRAYDAKMTFTT